MDTKRLQAAVDEINAVIDGERAQYEQETAQKEPKFIPWTAETFPKDRPVWVRHASSTKSAFLVTYVGPRGISTHGHEMIEWNHLSNYTQHDGTPCGTEA
jgi:hypothetical protein